MKSQQLTSRSRRGSKSKEAIYKNRETSNGTTTMQNPNPSSRSMSVIIVNVQREGMKMNEERSNVPIGTWVRGNQEKWNL